MSDDTKPADWREAFVEKWAERIASIAYAAEGAVHQGATMNVMASARIELRALLADLPPQAGLDPLTPATPERGLSDWERTCLAWAEGYIGRREGEDERTFAGGAQAVIARLLSVPLLWRWRQPSLTGGAECACEPPVREPTDDSKRIANWLDAMAEEYRKTGNESRVAGLWWAASGIRLGAWRDHPETTEGRASMDGKGGADE